MKLGSVVGAVAILAFLAGCSESPAAPGPASRTDEEFAALLAEIGAVDDRAEAPRVAAPAVPTLRFLLHRALHQVAVEEGITAARAIALELRQKQLEIRRAALEAGTREARQEALATIELEAAKVVVDILGPDVVERVMEVAANRIATLEARIEAAPGGANKVRLERLLAERREELELAEANFESDPAQALLRALRAVHGVPREL